MLLDVIIVLCLDLLLNILTGLMVPDCQTSK